MLISGVKKILTLKTKTMNEVQIFETAQQMFLQERGRKDVIEFMIANGMDPSDAEAKATEAFLSIRDQRRAMAMDTEDVSQDGGGNGIVSIVIGVVLILIGIGASMGTNRIFYGAVLVGGITLIQGLAKAMR